LDNSDISAKENTIIRMRECIFVQISYTLLINKVYTKRTAHAANMEPGRSRLLRFVQCRMH